MCNISINVSIAAKLFGVLSATVTPRPCGTVRMLYIVIKLRAPGKRAHANN